jgi:hypothetical protein
MLSSEPCSGSPAHAAMSNVRRGTTHPKAACVNAASREITPN